MRVIRVVTTVQEYNVPDGFDSWPAASQRNSLAELEGKGGYKELPHTESYSYPELVKNAAGGA
ncbi:hypothetical protein NLX86_31680 [Streptomyces sp. A3M-1-3]|uniref:hypothetical protein n=1 Tax=Streptomyces sp. A3M-1-3 TaxID=2962044 RepID=UPI0020B70FBC|nr:hypothetical protein [Streptomyces sp. A3M-1-3]MCP3822484.1 hypothetical protein [Streptomyces sp. A3M-1-3]